MKITESSLYHYCREGRYGGQIPTLTLHLGEGPIPAPTDIVDVPDEWFLKLDSAGLPTTRRDHYLFWSRKGFAKNEARLRAEFKTADHFRSGENYDYGLTFEMWKSLCEQKWENTDKLVSKKLASMSKKMAAYKAFLKESE